MDKVYTNEAYQSHMAYGDAEGMAACARMGIIVVGAAAAGVTWVACNALKFSDEACANSAAGTFVGTVVFLPCIAYALYTINKKKED